MYLPALGGRRHASLSLPVQDVCVSEVGWNGRDGIRKEEGWDEKVERD